MTDQALAFSTKAGTLALLAGRLQGAVVLPQVLFTVADWRLNAGACLARLHGAGWPHMAVRSSSAREDGEQASAAGEYESCLNVTHDEVEAAVERVLDSMGGQAAWPDDQFFVQPMVTDVSLAGVGFGLDPATLAPYFVINYDESSGLTDSVTSGRSNELKILRPPLRDTGSVGPGPGGGRVARVAEPVWSAGHRHRICHG